MALTIAFTACSESNDEEEEFTEWQSTNDSYFDNLYAQTKAKIAAGDASWKIIKNWTLDSGNVAMHSYDHNLTRTRNQWHLFLKAKEHEAEMKQFICGS